MDDLVVLLIFAVVAGLGALFKSRQDAKARAERERRRLEERTSIAPPPVRSVPTEVEREDQEETEPEEASDEGQTRSPLEEFRRFVREAQEREQRRHAPPEPRPAPVPPPPPKPVRRVLTVRREAAEGDEGPSGTSLADVFAQRERREAAQKQAAAAAVKQAAAPTVAPAPDTEHRPPQLSDIVASEQSDLAKAVVLREILGLPVALRPQGMPLARR